MVMVEELEECWHLDVVLILEYGLGNVGVDVEGLPCH